MPRRVLKKMVTMAALTVMVGAGISKAHAADVVLYTSDASSIQGNWSAIGSSTGAGGQTMSSQDWGWSTTDAPRPSPSDYFEAQFNASANTDYHVWVRLRAGGNSKWNDSAWVQFSDSTDTNGSWIYRINSGSALLVNLEGCSGCGVNGWGWKDGAYWLSQPSIIRFSSSGTHTVRVQTREDGVQVDQIVLSSSSYLWSAPGQPSGDSTIVPKSGGSSGGGSGGGSSSPYSGTPSPIPGIFLVQDFDNGGEGVAYHDTTPGNQGGAYRQTNVDIANSSEGGYTIGWVSAGEWLNYTVNVTASGTYTATFRVASQGSGGTFHLEMNGSNVSGTISVPNTGGWQSWTNVSANVNLTAGQQVARIVMDSIGSSGAVANISSFRFTSGGTSGGSSSVSGPSPYAGRIALPGWGEAENFDNGGEGVSYHDTTGGNAGGAYRSTDVDLAANGEGGVCVGWVSAGEWLNYSVSVASSGTYTLTFRVASLGPGGSFHVEMNGYNVGNFSVPNTGGWTSWQTISKTVDLNGGNQTMRVVMDSASGAVANFDAFQVTAGSAPTPPPTGGGSGGSGGSGGGSFRMMTWNIKHGFNAGNGYDLYAQMQFIVSQGPDVVALQEVQTWDENQPVRIEQLLEQMTGQNWTVVWAPVVNSSGTEGNIIATRLSVSGSDTFQMHATGDWSAMLSNRSTAMARVNVGGVAVNVFATHLDYGNTSWRSTQESQMMDWTAGFGGPRVVGGDFNSWWGEYWITNMTSQYSDTWKDVTGSNENGYTVNGAVRFDYLFRAYDGNWRVTPTNVWVPATSLSDHYPVVADFRVQ